MLRCSPRNTSNLSLKYLVNAGYKLDTSLNFPIMLWRLKTKKLIKVPTSILCWADLFYSRSNCIVRMMRFSHPTYTHQFWRDFFIYNIQNQLDSMYFSINSNSSRDPLAFKLFRLIMSALFSLSNGMKCFSFLKTGLKKYFHSEVDKNILWCSSEARMIHTAALQIQYCWMLPLTYKNML